MSAHLLVEEIAKELDMTTNDVKESMKTLVVTIDGCTLVEGGRF